MNWLLISDFIRTVPDYPKEGVTFYDLNSLFSSPAWHHYVKLLAENIQRRCSYITHIVGVESRGFVVGSAVSHAMNLPFTMIRKKGSKYPGTLLEATYELEYGSDALVLQKGILGHTSRVVIVDDLIATGGSIQATDQLVQKTGAKVLGYATVLNLSYLNSLENVISLKDINK